MRKLFIIVVLFWGMFPFFWTFAMSNNTDTVDQNQEWEQKVLGFSFVRNFFNSEKTPAESTGRSLIIQKRYRINNTYIKSWTIQNDVTTTDNSVRESQRDEPQKEDTTIVKKDPKLQRINELKSSVAQIIPLAEKFRYPTNKLKLYYKQLDSYVTWDIQRLTINIRNEIDKIRVFIKAKNK